MTNIKEHFPYPDNPLNEGRASLDALQNSEIINADAAALHDTETTEPVRRFTAPSIGGEGDVVDRETADKPLPVAGESLRADEVGKINYAEIRRRLGMPAVEQQVAEPMHVDGRVPGQVPSANARPGLPAGAKPSKFVESLNQLDKNR